MIFDEKYEGYEWCIYACLALVFFKVQQTKMKNVFHLTNLVLQTDWLPSLKMIKIKNEYVIQL